MDPRPENSRDDSVVVTGLGHALGAVDPMPYLKVKKLRKYMGLQDDLAVVAAGKALESANLLARSASEETTSLGERTGLYLAVGYIPFEQSDIEPLLANSLDAQGRFSMEAFSTTGYRAVNGLLTFRCLPNMPAFHVSANYDIQGPYFVTYPGAGQFYQALEQAFFALIERRVDIAIVAGVAHQRNFLVASHFGRIEPRVSPEQLLDAAGCLVLEPESLAATREAEVRLRLSHYDIYYHDHNPLEDTRVHLEYMKVERRDEISPPGELGPASLPVMLSLAWHQNDGDLYHFLQSRDGLSAASVWGRP